MSQERDVKEKKEVNKIIVQRTSEWANKGREIGLYLNEEKIGTIKDGETKEFHVEPGELLLYAGIDWCRSPIIEFDMNSDQTLVVELSGFNKSKWLFPALLIASVLSWFLSRSDLNFLVITWIIIMPLLFYLLYFVSFGRKKYLQLKIINGAAQLKNSNKTSL